MYFIIIESFVFSGLSRNRRLRDKQRLHEQLVRRARAFYISFYFVLWFEFIKTVLSSSKRQEKAREGNQCHLFRVNVE